MIYKLALPHRTMYFETRDGLEEFRKAVAAAPVSTMTEEEFNAIRRSKEETNAK